MRKIGYRAFHCTKHWRIFSWNYIKGCRGIVMKIILFRKKRKNNLRIFTGSWKLNIILVGKCKGSHFWTSHFTPAIWNWILTQKKNWKKVKSWLLGIISPMGKWSQGHMIWTGNLLTRFTVWDPLRDGHLKWSRGRIFSHMNIHFMKKIKNWYI